MQIEPIAALRGMRDAVLRAPADVSFGDALGSAIDGLSGTLAHADALAANVASGKATIADASIARAKADVMLEVAAIAAARVSGAISQLLQTQV
jgi:flagellar hook-basal body complex protein FliE